MTLEMKDAGGLVERVGGLIMRLVNQGPSDHGAGGKSGSSEGFKAMQDMLGSSLAKESAVGVFAVGKTGQTFKPQLLGVSRVTKDSAALFEGLLPKKPGAKVGNYQFGRQGSLFAGMSGGLVYFSTDKDLLMSYLGRLSGKNAPRLVGSQAYTTPKRNVGAQELSVFMNFSASAKVIRSQLAQMFLPRLFSPAVDALDTLGQYAGGLSTTNAGLNASSALVANAEGKDQPLYRILTHSTEFHVQDIIPGTAEGVTARACAPESGAYVGRWLTRFDLLDPTGFLTDSQLAAHLERAGQYLGSECAQVTLAGSSKAALLDSKDTLASLKQSVSYQRVRDMKAASEHMPAYTQSVNEALRGMSGALDRLLKDDAAGGVTKALPMQAGLTNQMGSSLDDLSKSLANLKMVYAFRGDYLITAFSPEALAAALDEKAPTLAQNTDFQNAKLGLSGAGWTYQTNRPDVTPEEIGALLPEDLMGDSEEDLLAELDNEDLTDEERATLEELLAEQQDAASMPQQMKTALADLINRYDGQTSQTQVTQNVVLTKASVKYRW